MGALSTGVLGFHLVKIAGLAAAARNFPVLRRDSGITGPTTSFLVPARNEEHNLPHLLQCLMRQPALEILVLDDESMDGTAAIVARLSTIDSRVRLIRGAPKPAGWIGKNWACAQLAAVAQGELLAFVDADVTLRAGALQAVWAQIHRQEADVFSVFPRQETRSLGECLFAPLIDENLLAFLPSQLLRLPIPAAAAANGQFLAFSRKAYDIVGGHEAVAGDIVEDLALARRTRKSGLRLGLALGGDLMKVRMYRGYQEAVRGLGKSMRRAHADSDLVLAASAALVHLAYTLPWLLPGPRWRISALLALAERVIANRLTGRGAYAESLLVPFTATAAIPVYAKGFQRTARWKGRDYR